MYHELGTAAPSKAVAGASLRHGGTLVGMTLRRRPPLLTGHEHAALRDGAGRTAFFLLVLESPCRN